MCIYCRKEVGGVYDKHILSSLPNVAYSTVSVNLKACFYTVAVKLKVNPKEGLRMICHNPGVK